MVYPENLSSPLVMNIVSRLTLSILFLTLAGQLLGQTPESFLQRVESFRDQGEMAAALPAAQGAVKLAGDDLLWQANLALFEVQVARQDLTAAEVVLAKLASPPEGISITQSVRFMIAKGQLNLLVGRTDEAKDLGEQALKLVLTHDQSLPLVEAESRSFLGLTYWTSGSYEQALDQLQQTLILRERTLGEEHLLAAGALINLGLVHASQGDWSTARGFYQRASAVYEATGATDKTAYLSALTNVAVANLSGAVATLQQYGISLGESAAPSPFGAGTGLITDGSPEQSARRQLQMAHDGFVKVREAYVKREGTQHPRVAFMDAYLGQVAHHRGDYHKALNHYHDAQLIYDLVYDEHHPDLANVWNLTGQTLLAQGEYEAAVHAHQQALVANHLDFNPVSDAENPGRGVTAFRKELVVSTLQFKARALETLHFGESLKKQHLEQALACIQLADAQLQVLRQSRVREADRLALGKLGESIYADGVRLCEALASVSLKKAPYQQLAFAFAEASKAAVLQQTIAESEARAFVGVPVEVLTQERDLVTKIAYWEQRLAQNPYDDQVGEWYSTLADLRSQRDALLKELEERYPDYYGLKYANQSTTVAEVQAQLAPGVAMISYLVRSEEGRLSIFWLTNQDFGVVHHALSEGFSDRIAAMRNYMKYQVEQGYSENMYPLYQELFPRSLRLPKEVNTLVLVPHQNLSMIPWEALPTAEIDPLTAPKDWPYLINQYTLQYSYSAGLYVQLQRKAVAAGQDGMYVMAPVNFEEHHLAALPGTRQELNNLTKIAAGGTLPVTARSDAEASELIFRLENLKQYPILHLATHGVVDADAPELSRLYFGVEDPQVSEADGLVYAGDIYGLALDADLVTLSACETGLGRLRSGEGLLGLTRAFFYAGSRRLLVSLWTVNDNSTSLLSTQLYYHALQEQKSWPEALRQSKLELIRGGTYAAPYYWAPFVLVGK